MSLYFGRVVPIWNEKKQQHKNGEITAMQEGVTTKNSRNILHHVSGILEDEKPVSDFPLIVGDCDTGSKKQDKMGTL